MIRKLLLVAAAITMPMSAGAVAIVGTASVSGAATAINCDIAGTVTLPRRACPTTVRSP